MAADEGGATTSSISKDDANLVAWWRFDEGKGYAIKVRWADGGGSLCGGEGCEFRSVVGAPLRARSRERA
jgi:hypothetical protein